MSNLEMLDKICKETKQSPEMVREVAAKALRELNCIATFDEKKATAALMECYWAFGAEAVYYLGGIMLGGGNPDDSWVHETLACFIGCGNEEFNAVRDGWIKLVEKHKGLRGPS